MNRPDKPACIRNFQDQLNDLGRVFYKSNFGNQPFPYSFYDLCFWHAKSANKAVSIWLSCHAGERLRADFESLDLQISKSTVRLGNLEGRLKRVSEESAKSARALQMLDDARGDIEVACAMMYGFLTDMELAFNWTETPPEVPEQKPQSIPELEPEFAQAVTSYEKQRLEKQPVAPGDGLYETERCLIWGGVRYERLTDKMVGVLRVFVDRYEKGFPIVRVDSFNPPFDGGFIGQAFKLNRKGEPPIHKVAEAIEKVADGEYRLIDPGIKNRKVPE